MRLQAASAHRWPLGALFVLIATALVAVFGITAANAAARQVTGAAASEALPPVSTPDLPSVASVSADVPERSDDAAPAPAAAAAPEPVRPATVLPARPAPAAAVDRLDPGIAQPERGRAPPA
jgi:hypothetical protein